MHVENNIPDMHPFAFGKDSHCQVSKLKDVLQAAKTRERSKSKQ